ncbi:MAG: hypothetical protein C0501_20990 [Isosphaera sp.]|nr:hypothetical protein [Isosphaera sp.]
MTDGTGGEFRSAEHYLAVWVETQNVSGNPMELRPWVNPPASSAMLIISATRSVPLAKLPAGQRHAGTLEGGHRMEAGDPPVVDVLVFTLPDPAVKSVALKLDAKHVGAPGVFSHLILATAWRK